MTSAGSFIPREITAVTIEYKAVWAPEPDWTLEERSSRVQSGSGVQTALYSIVTAVISLGMKLPAA